MVPDRIEKTIILRAPRARVWRALADVREFGAWFGMSLSAPFEPGTHLRGQMVPTTADPEVAKQQAPHAGAPVELWVEQVEPERRLAFRWHPHAPELTAEAVAAEPTTLVVFELADADGGTRLTITESGFSAIPLERRAAAFHGNEGGWEAQTRLISKYLATHAG
jgi:uncharacterized protein YndB with AHSA1/START domain